MSNFALVAIFMIEEDDIELPDDTLDNHRKKRKKTMILLLPLLIVIGVSVGIYFALNDGYDSLGVNYNIVQYNKNSTDNVTVFYDLPEIKTTVSDKNRNVNLRLKINIELSSIDDLRVIEALSAKLVDTVIGHTIELRLDEIKGSTGLYWLKEEILYRLSLAASPVKIKNINFSLFEIEE